MIRFFRLSWFTFSSNRLMCISFAFFRHSCSMFNFLLTSYLISSFYNFCCSGGRPIWLTNIVGGDFSNSIVHTVAPGFFVFIDLISNGIWSHGSGSKNTGWAKTRSCGIGSDSCDSIESYGFISMLVGCLIFCLYSSCCSGRLIWFNCFIIFSHRFDFLIYILFRLSWFMECSRRLRWVIFAFFRYICCLLIFLLTS